MFNKDSLHHAYFIEGGSFDEVTRELRKIDFEFRANPDFWHLERENLTVDDARTIKDLQSQRPLVSERRVFVIETFAMTTEAQNALLKVFEEPTAGALFIIIAPRAHILLATLRSRMVVVSAKNRKPESFSLIDPKKFIESPVARRIEMLKPILEATDADGNKKADKKAAAAFLSALREECGMSALFTIDEALLYLFDKSSSVKILLENVSMSI